MAKDKKAPSRSKNFHFLSLFCCTFFSNRFTKNNIKIAYILIKYFLLNFVLLMEGHFQKLFLSRYIFLKIVVFNLKDLTFINFICTLF